jgi:hypothetical protein
MTALRRLLAGDRTFAVALFALLVLVVFVDGRLSLALLDVRPHAGGIGLPGWLEAYGRFDSGWYRLIAHDGYSYGGPGRQSSVAFFPAYPTAMRVVGLVTGNVAVAGVLVTLACGVGIAVLFHGWVRAFLGARVARFSLALLLCYPFAFYLGGVVYSDALFLVAALVAFTLLERDHAVLAGLAGIVATAARPVGVAVVVGLLLRSLELHQVLPRPERGLLPRRLDLRRLRWQDGAVLVAGLGLVAFAALLWVRFHDPLAFTKVSDAPGWDKGFDLETIAKLHLFRLLRAFGLNLVTFWLVVQGVFAVLALALVPAVVRRFGIGYGAYLLVAVGIAFASTRDFIGMGRYVLAGFPAFAAAGDLVLGWSDHARRRLRWLPAATLAGSSALLLWMASLFARWYFLS